MLELNKAVLEVLIGFICLNVWVKADNYIEDYCWRDYKGVVPKDAFEAGTDMFGKTIYIGQALYENAIVPGSIRTNKNEIEIEYNKARTINEAIKILCTPYPEKFEWLKTRYDEVIKIHDKHLFDGGYEEGYKTYIGRVETHEELTVGKVQCYDDVCYKLTTVHNGDWVDHKEFEILVFNPNGNSTLPTSVKRISRTPNNPSFLTYFFLVLVIGGLIVIVIVLLRRC